MLDLIADLSVPAIAVARAALGTINHTSLTINALKQREVPIMGIIMNCFKNSTIENDNRKIVSELNRVPVIGVVPYSKNLKSLADDFERHVDVQKL